jgi:hypothetical protein
MTVKEYIKNKEFYNKFAIYICQKLDYLIDEEMYHGEIEWYNSHKEDILVYIGGEWDSLHIKSFTRGLFLNSTAMKILISELKKIGYDRS